MRRDLLERPFEPHQIKTRPGPSGRPYAYIEGHEYIRRLNEAFDGRWSFVIVDHKLHERDVVILGKLEAEGIAKYAFGGAQIKRSSKNGEPLNLGDDYKAAATDSLKKAASLFGMGLHLHRSESEEGSSELGSADGGEARPVPQPPQSPPRAAPRPQKPQGSPLTERQLNAINAIAKSLNWTREDLRQKAIASHGAPPEELSRSAASALITELQNLSTESAA